MPTLNLKPSPELLARLKKLQLEDRPAKKRAIHYGGMPSPARIPDPFEYVFVLEREITEFSRGQTKHKGWELVSVWVSSISAHDTDLLDKPDGVKYRVRKMPLYDRRPNVPTLHSGEAEGK